MRVLVVKTSSMGDVIHTLPALTDAGKALPQISFDWVVEENFAEIPRWHPLVKTVIPIAWRRWRKKIFSTQHRQEWKNFCNELRKSQYDLIIDAQGLMKSALFAFLAKGPRAGFSFKSARESVASLFYQQTFTVTRDQHAINRVRSLFAQALNYATPTSVPDYGIDRAKLLSVAEANQPAYLVFLHGTTWETKHWPENYWLELAKMVVQQGYKIKLPWGNAVEEERARRIASQVANVEVLPRLNLEKIAKVLAGAKAIVAVDTGLGHLAAALNVPTISLYGPTNPALTGALGQSQIHLAATFSCAPCFGKVCTFQNTQAIGDSVTPACFSVLSPAKVYEQLLVILKS